MISSVLIALQLVTGATGRVGQLTVRKILEMYPRVLVRAVVNDIAKGKKVLKEEEADFGVKLEVRGVPWLTTKTIQHYAVLVVKMWSIYDVYELIEI